MRHIIIATMEDKPGVLNRVVMVFRRRNYNIESLAVGHTEITGVSRMTVVVEEGDRKIVEQMVKDLDKLVNVLEVTDISDQPSVVRELALIRVNATSSARHKIIQLVDIFRAKVVDVASGSLTIEITGTEDKINSLAELLRPFGISEMVRTGQVAMLRGENGGQNCGERLYSVAQVA